MLTEAERLRRNETRKRNGAAEIERQAAEGQAALQKLADEAAEAMRGTL